MRIIVRDINSELLSGEDKLYNSKKYKDLEDLLKDNEYTYRTQSTQSTKITKKKYNNTLSSGEHGDQKSLDNFAKKLRNYDKNQKKLERYHLLDYSIEDIHKINDIKEYYLNDEKTNIISKSLKYNINNTEKSNRKLGKAYSAKVLIEMYKKYTNDMYVLETEIIFFPNSELNFAEEMKSEKVTYDTENSIATSYNSASSKWEGVIKYNDYSKPKIVKDILYNGVYYIEGIEISKTYKKQLYIDNNYDLNDDRLKYSNFKLQENHNHLHDHKHHTINDKNKSSHSSANKLLKHRHLHNHVYDTHDELSKYTQNKSFINKLLCHKKDASEELLHNYILLDDNFHRHSGMFS